MPISEIPVRLCCMQRHWGPVCPDGKVMCCICFDRFTKDELFKDLEGLWDMCKECGVNEQLQNKLV